MIKLVMNEEKIELDLVEGQEITISDLIEEMSVACGYRSDYLADKFGGIDEDDTSIGLDTEKDNLIVFFEILEYNDEYTADSLVKIERASIY